MNRKVLQVSYYHIQEGDGKMNKFRSIFFFLVVALFTFGFLMNAAPQGEKGVNPVIKDIPVWPVDSAVPINKTSGRKILFDITQMQQNPTKVNWGILHAADLINVYAIA